MKKNYWYLIAGLFIIILVAVFAIGRSPREGQSDVASRENGEGLGNKEVQTQTYLASNTPSVKTGDKIIGNSQAALKIFVYEDYVSRYSADLADTLDKVKAESGDKLAIVVRPYITRNSANALRLAQAVDCAGEQGKWLEMRALLFSKAKNQQFISDDLVDDIAQLNLDNEVFSACLTNQDKSGTIEQSVAEAGTYGVMGAPTMFIGGEIIIGARPYDDFTDSNGDLISGLKSVVENKLSL